MLDDAMKRVVDEVRLGFVASVNADGTPNLSPKGTTAVWDDENLVFAHLHSHQTVANIEQGRDAVEVNVVDPIRRKGYRFKGRARSHRTGDEFEAGLRFFHQRSGLVADRIDAIVLIHVEHAAALVSPAYDDGTAEEVVEQRVLAMYGLQRRPPEARDGYGSVTARIFAADFEGVVDFFGRVFDTTGDVVFGRLAELRIGDSVVMISSTVERPEFPAFLYIYVDDAERTYRKALAAGATSIEEPFDTHYGDRRAMVRDPFGNVYHIAHVKKS